MYTSKGGITTMDNNDMVVLTGSALITLLSQIEELKGLDLEITELDDYISVKIGENTYELEAPVESTVSVDSETFDNIDELNTEGYEEFDDEMTDEAVEGGIIKELIKTLAVGGLVRLTKDAIVNS